MYNIRNIYFGNSYEQHSIEFWYASVFKKLIKAGFTEQQAEVQAEAMKYQSDTVQEFIDQNVATKGDMKRLEREIRAVEERITNRVNEMGYKITIRLGGMLVAGIVVLGALIKF